MSHSCSFYYGFGYQLKQKNKTKVMNNDIKREAAQIVFEHYSIVMDMDKAKKCAIATVDKVKEKLLRVLDNDISSIHAIYWEKVKKEIEKL
jgi:hypothetical protein